MIANESKTDVTTESATRTPRVRRSAAVGVVALLALAACTSDPGPRKVAEDIIRAEALENPSLDEDCMLAVLDDFDDEQLEQIAGDLGSSNADTSAGGQAELDAYQAALEACNA